MSGVMAAVEFLHRIQSIVEELRGRAADDLLHPPSEPVIGEARRAATADRGQMITGIPGVRVGAVAHQVAVGIIAQGRTIELGLRVVGIVDRAGFTRHIRWQAHRGEAARGRRPAAVRIISIGQIAQIGGRTGTAPAGAEGDRSHPRVVVVAIRRDHPVGQRQTGAPVGIVVVQPDVLAALGNCGQTVGVVPSVSHLRLPTTCIVLRRPALS